MYTPENIYQLSSFTSLPGIVHGYSSKSFGDTGDVDSSISDGMRSFAHALAIPNEQIVRMKQTHGTTVRVVGKNDWGKTFADTDALITKEMNTFLCVRVADCLPILMYSPKKAVGAVHAGWRGVYNGILSETIAVMRSEGVDSKNLYVGIGPSIHSCCYEVDNQRKDIFKEKFGRWSERAIVQDNGKWYINLQELARLQIIEAGVQAENVEVSNVCTFDSDKFFSYRREVVKENSKRFCGVIGML